MKTMQCPDCQGGGNEIQGGKCLKVEVYHDKSACPQKDMHFARTDRDFGGETDYHHVLCDRCDGSGRVASTEALLVSILSTLLKQQYKSPTGK